MKDAMGKNKDAFKRRRWIWDSRTFNFISGCCNNWLHHIRYASRWCVSPNAHKKRRSYDKNKQFWLLGDIRGITTSAEIMFYVPILAFLLFSGVDYYLTSMQHNNLESRKNYYLDIMRIEGTYTQELHEKINSELTSMGFKSVTIRPSININENKYRNIDNPSQARMGIEIEAEPSFKPFLLGRLLGVVDSSNTFKFKVKGEALSEKPNY